MFTLHFNNGEMLMVKYFSLKNKDKKSYNLSIGSKKGS